MSIFIIVGIAGLVYLADTIYKSDIFNVKRIHTNIELKDAVKNDIAGTSLFNLNTKKILNGILNEHPEYKEVHVIKEFPSSVRIEIVKRVAIAQIKGERYYSIDSEGVVIDDGQRRPLKDLIPIEIADFNRRLKKGQRIADERLKYAFDVIEGLEREGFLEKFNVKVINATALPVLYFVMDGAKIIIGKDDIMKRFDILKNLAQKTLRSKFSSVDYVDLRYNKVYVGYRR